MLWDEGGARFGSSVGFGLGRLACQHCITAYCYGPEYGVRSLPPFFYPLTAAQDCGTVTAVQSYYGVVLSPARFQSRQQSHHCHASSHAAISVL